MKKKYGKFLKSEQSQDLYIEMFLLKPNFQLKSNIVTRQEPSMIHSASPQSRPAVIVV